MKYILTFAFVVLFSVAAQASCVEPVSPYGNGPIAPRCTNNICSANSALNYKSQVEHYIAQLRRYVSDAAAFAQCKQNYVASDWTRFVSSNKVRK